MFFNQIYELVGRFLRLPPYLYVLRYPHMFMSCATPLRPSPALPPYLYVLRYPPAAISCATP